MSASPDDFTVEHARALARNHLAFFARGAFQALHPNLKVLWNWHLDLIANRLEDVIEGRMRRLIINIPPRYGKSMMASVALPAYMLGRNPYAKIVCVSYARDLAEKMASDTRRLINSPFYRSLFATRLVNSRARLGELTTPEGGFRLATSVDGTLTGRGGQIMIVDDPLKPNEAASDVQRQSVNDWFDRTATTRPDDKERDAIVVIMQRLHEDDLVGHLMRQGHWAVLSLPVLAEEDETHIIRTPFGERIVRRSAGCPLHPERESLERIQESARVMGSYGFAAQCQQRPAPSGGGLIKIELFNRYNLDAKPTFRRIVQSWDSASKGGKLNDYSCCTTWGVTSSKDIYLLHVYRAQIGYPELKRKVRELSEQFCAGAILVEDAASGIKLCQELCGEGFSRLLPIKPIGDKEARMDAQTPMIEAGGVFIPREAPWLAAYLHELAMFPNGRFDDQVDSTSQALKYIGIRSGPEQWLETYRLVELDRYGLTDEDLVVTFDHYETTLVFQTSCGRPICRDYGGFYRVTLAEWESCQRLEGVTLIELRATAKG